MRDKSFNCNDHGTSGQLAFQCQIRQLNWLVFAAPTWKRQQALARGRGPLPARRCVLCLQNICDPVCTVSIFRKSWWQPSSGNICQGSSQPALRPLETPAVPQTLRSRKAGRARDALA